MRLAAELSRRALIFYTAALAVRQPVLPASAESGDVLIAAGTVNLQKGVEAVNGASAAVCLCHIVDLRACATLR